MIESLTVTQSLGVKLISEPLSFGLKGFSVACSFGFQRSLLASVRRMGGDQRHQDRAREREDWRDVISLRRSNDREDGYDHGASGHRGIGRIDVPRQHAESLSDEAEETRRWLSMFSAFHCHGKRNHGVDLYVSAG